MDDYFYSVGGAVHIGETAEDAVKREVLEETGVSYEVDHLAVIHENFFMGSSGLKGVECHELAFYYVMKPMGKRVVTSQSRTMSGVKETMHWIPMDELDNVKAYPSFMKEFLQTPHTGVVHIITDERIDKKSERAVTRRICDQAVCGKTDRVQLGAGIIRSGF